VKRRGFLNSCTAAGLGLSAAVTPSFAATPDKGSCRYTFSLTDNQSKIYTRAAVKPTKIMHITDTHLSLDDERGAPFREYSQRMAGAYKSNRHFRTGESFSADENFLKTLEIAQKDGVDFIALTGDIVSFPSLAGVDWLCQNLAATGIPYAYVAGNHDWHFEGMEGSAEELRGIWTAKHLAPLYQGKDPLSAAYTVNGITLLCIDNSTNEILPEQLAFFNEQAASGNPMLLLMHIPLYVPGRSIGFGCGHPEWGEKTDRNFEIERRRKWRKDGHTQTTMDFCEAVFEAPNLLAILAGHIHENSLDIKNDVPQIVSRENASGYYKEFVIQTVGEG
jgi:predicted phosphodiesterase